VHRLGDKWNLDHRTSLNPPDRAVVCCGMRLPRTSLRWTPVLVLAGLAACHPTTTATPGDALACVDAHAQPGVTDEPDAHEPAPTTEPETKAKPRPPRTFDVAAIDAYVAQMVDHDGLVGLSLGIMRNGEIVLAKGYGLRNVESQAKVEPTTEFAIASITKQFICAGASKLAEERKLSLDHKVATYFPDLTRAKDITLFDALAHVSGYPDFYPLDYVIPRMAEPADTDALIAEFGGRPLDFEPRSRWSYSNTGYLIVGRIIERITKRGLDTFLAERIFEPVGMTQTFFGTGTTPPSAATGYTSFALGDDEPATPEGAGWVHAAGAMWSTPTDLLRWDLALVSGEVLNKKSYERMTRAVRLSDGRMTSYGCGIGLRRVDGESVLVHTGGVSGFASKNVVIPRTKSAVVIMSNGTAVSSFPILDTILGLVIDADRATPRAPTIDGPAPDEVARGLIRQMQAGVMERSKLSEDFNAYLDAAHLAQAAPRLKALGEPTRVEVERISERGGMEVSRMTIHFADREVRATMFRRADGIVEQFLLRKK